MKRKVVLAVVVLFIASLWAYHRQDQRRRALYETLAQKISVGLAQTASHTDTEWSLENQPAVDVVLISEGYVLTHENLLATGLVSSPLAKRLAANNADNDGTYLQLVKDDRIMAFVALPLGIELVPGNHFFLIRPSSRIIFRFKKTNKGNQLMDIH